MSNIDAIRRDLMEHSEAMGAILDVVDGHRAQLIERGYSPTAAEQGAMEYHRYLLAAAFRREDT